MAGILQSIFSAFCGWNYMYFSCNFTDFFHEDSTDSELAELHVQLLVTSMVNPAQMSNHMSSKVWDEITYPFSNFNGCTIELWERINKFILYLMMDVITYSARIKVHPCQWKGLQAAGYSLNQLWPRPIMPSGITKPQWVVHSITVWSQTAESCI